MVWVWEKESHWNRQLEDPPRLWEQTWHGKSLARKQWGLSPLWELQFLCGCGCGLLHRVPWNVHPIEREEWGIYYLFSERQKASRSNSKKVQKCDSEKMFAEEEGLTLDLGYTRHCQGSGTKAIPTGNKRKLGGKGQGVVSSNGGKQFSLHHCIWKTSELPHRVQAGASQARGQQRGLSHYGWLLALRREERTSLPVSFLMMAHVQTTL